VARIWSTVKNRDAHEHQLAAADARACCLQPSPPATVPYWLTASVKLRAFCDLSSAPIESHFLHVRLARKVGVPMPMEGMRARALIISLLIQVDA